MKNAYYLLASSLLLATGCEKVHQTQEAYSSLSKLSEAGSRVEQGLKEAEARHEARVKTGDTLALPYRDLEAYLPATLGGYAGGELKGETTKAGTTTYSLAERTYRKGDTTAEVKLVDYNGATALYRMAAMVTNLGLDSEDAESLTRTVVLTDGVKALEQLHKKTGEANLTVAVGDRFLLTLKANNQQNLAQVEGMAKQLNLAALRKL